MTMINKKLVVDSSVLVSMLKHDEENSDSSLKFFDFVLKNNYVFLMPILILFEVFHSLDRKDFFKNPLNFKKCMKVFNTSCFEYIDLNFGVFNVYKEIHFLNNLKTSDSIIASMSILTNSDLISLDNNLISRVPNSYTPSQFLKRFAN